MVELKMKMLNDNDRDLINALDRNFDHLLIQKYNFPCSQ